MSLTVSNIQSSFTVVLNNKIYPFPVTTVTGGQEPIFYNITPRLPAGMSINIGTGLIVGTPGIAAPNTVHTITVTDATGANANTDIELIVHVPPEPANANVAASNLVVNLNTTNIQTAIVTIEDLQGNDDNFDIVGDSKIGTLGFTRFNSNVLFDDRLTADHAYYIHRYL